MDFKKWALFLCSSSLLIGCVYSDPDSWNRDDEDIIGNKLTSMSALSAVQQPEINTLAIFDETVRKIHRFDLKNDVHLSTFEVKNPDQEHFVLQSDSGSYTVDLTKKHISVYSNTGVVQHDPIQFYGKPLSAAFRPDLGYLVMYDDLMNVGILKLDEQGSVADSLMLGPILSENTPIRSGDISSSGKLVLALSDNSMAIVDLALTLSEKKWNFSTFSTGLLDIKWVAPSRENVNEVLVRSADKIALINTDTKSVVDSWDLDTANTVVKKYSKNQDPHVIVGDKGQWTTGSNVKIIYPQGGSLKIRTISRSRPFYMVSQLDLINDTWSTVDLVMNKEPGWGLDSEGYWTYNSLNDLRESRRYVRFRFSDQLTQSQKDLPNNARIKMSKDVIFSLYPSELGFAEKWKASSDQKSVFKLFNLRHL
ncbi:MAG: hypothetical protein KDD61_08875 [Bdellovibrionales bacterium]|nr:hypothetical protein [Bdellovibrionales bacterium]